MISLKTSAWEASPDRSQTFQRANKRQPQNLPSPRDKHIIREISQLSLLLETNHRDCQIRNPLGGHKGPITFLGFLLARRYERRGVA